MWEAVEASARKVGMGKAEGRRGKRGSREEKGGKGEEEGRRTFNFMDLSSLSSKNH